MQTGSAGPVLFSQCDSAFVLQICTAHRWHASPVCCREILCNTHVVMHAHTLFILVAFWSSNRNCLWKKLLMCKWIGNIRKLNIVSCFWLPGTNRLVWNHRDAQQELSMTFHESDSELWHYSIQGMLLDIWVLRGLALTTCNKSFMLRSEIGYTKLVKCEITFISSFHIKPLSDITCFSAVNGNTSTLQLSFFAL